MLSSSVSSFSCYRNSADRKPKGDATVERRNQAKLFAVVIHSALSPPRNRFLISDGISLCFCSEGRYWSLTQRQLCETSSVCREDAASPI